MKYVRKPPSSLVIASRGAMHRFMILCAVMREVSRNTPIATAYFEKIANSPGRR